MEFLIELIMELVLEGASETAKCSKVPKPLRIAAAVLVMLFFAAVLGVIALTGVLAFKSNVLLSVAVFALDVLLAVLLVRKIIKEVRKAKKGK